VGAAPLGSLSVDLDDEWAYRRSLGDPEWQERTSYFPALAPRLKELLEGRRATCFAVGHDARLSAGAGLLRTLHDDGHEIANHSDEHDLRLLRRGRAAIEVDLTRAGEAIAAVTGIRPAGFRSPGYGTSRDLRGVLAEHGYRYDASGFPSPLGPLSRVWFARHYPGPGFRAREVRDAAAELAGGVRPRRRLVEGRGLVDLPVTVVPYVRLPMHASYFLLLARRHPRLAFRYLDRALALCAWRGIGPALVVHPTDLLEAADSPALRRFPGMDIPARHKVELVKRWVRAAEARFFLGTVAAQAAAVAGVPR
jgi:hypothetical protein